MLNEYAQNEETDPPTAVASFLLSIFLICYIGFEVWYQWDFRGEYAVHIAVICLICAFFVIFVPLRLLELWTIKHLQTAGRVLTIVFAFATMFVISYFFNPDARHERWVKQFAPHLKTYTSLQPVDVKRPYDFVFGRVVVVERNRKGDKIEIVSNRLNRRLRADSPEEVSTVIWLDWDKKKLPDPKEAVVDTCHIRAINLKTQQLTAKHLIEAKWRLVRIKPKGEKWSGYLDDTTIYRYLRELPIKK